MGQARELMDRVTAAVFLVGTNTGPLTMSDGQQLPPTGKPMRLRSIDVVTVKGGLITKHDFYFDQLAMLEQLGLLGLLAAQPTAT